MSYRINGVDLSNFIYGWGTTLNNYNGFATAAVSAGLKIGDTMVKAVLKNSNFMPYSDADVFGFSSGFSDSNNSNLLPAANYAGVNRFITSNSPRLTRTDTEVTPIYYKGNGYNALGELRIGSATAPAISCPPVILVAIQGGGGNGSSGLARGNAYAVGINVWQHIGGNGGGSGGFACFQLRLPHDAATPTLVGYFQVGTSATVLKDAANVTFATAYKGSDGSMVFGTPDLWDGKYSHTQGTAGVGGQVSIVGTSGNFWYNANRGASGNSPVEVSVLYGASGGEGGYNYSKTCTSVSYVYGAWNGYGKNLTTIYLNSAISGNSIKGKDGGYGGGGQNGSYGAGGGGAGSMLGQGAYSSTSASETAYGAGGGGGTPTKQSWTIFTGGDARVSGGSGGKGCVQFYW